MDKELQDKIEALKRQHAIDKLFEMEPYTFSSELGQHWLKNDFNDQGPLASRRRAMPYQPRCGYGTYEEQMERLRLISTFQPINIWQ